MFTKEQQLKAWRISTLIMIVLAATVFFVQRLVGPVFDFVFEICVFYIPVFTIVGLFLYFRNKLR